jgi:hypothetical protein
LKIFLRPAMCLLTNSHDVTQFHRLLIQFPPLWRRTAPSVIWHANIRGYIQKFPDWPPAARTANGKLFATRCSCIAILWVSLVSFATMTLCVASQLVFIVVVVYFVIDSVRKLLDRPSYIALISEVSGAYRHSWRRLSGFKV